MLTFNRQAISIVAMTVFALLAGFWLLLREPAGGHDLEHGHEAAGAEAFERGPHGGRLLRDGDFALEVTIFETGVPPEFRLYAYQDEEPLAPSAFQAGIEVTRLGDRRDRFQFRPEGDYLRAQGSVKEPHSFDVSITAGHAGRQHVWTYASYEGRTRIAPVAAEAAGLVVEAAGPARLEDDLEVAGHITPNRDRVARIEARFPGLVREVRKSIGDTVAAGEVLAVVESNESLQPYSIKAPFGGTVLDRGTSPGAVAGSTPLFEVADLSTVWVDLHVFAHDVTRVQPGQPVHLVLPDGSEVTAPIERMAPQADPGSQTVTARAVVANAEGHLRPGQAVTGRIVVGGRDVPLAVKTSGLQRFRDSTVVYAQVGDTYEVRMLNLGQQHRGWVEVLGGLEPGERYVAENSFLVKADIEKSGASHDH